MGVKFWKGSESYVIWDVEIMKVDLKKIGNLRSHSKAEFIEIMNKMIMVMIIINSGINTGIGAWETKN